MPAARPARRPDPTKLILGAVALLVAVYAAGDFLVGTGIYSDCSWGFLVADAMAGGGAFNHLVEPDPGNIAVDRSWFLAVWSPGQYMLPHALESLGLKLGTAIAVVVTAFAALGLVGWYRLYRRWDFPPITAALAVAVVACTRRFAVPFGIYDGGEVLLFGAAPWFLLLLWRWQALTLPQALGLVLAIGALAFLKLSGIVLGYAALAAIVLPDLWPPHRLRLQRPFMAVTTAALFAAGFYALWLSHGWTAAAGKGAIAWTAIPPRFVEGWGATVMGLLSLGDLAARFLRTPGHPVIASLDTLYLVLGLPAFALIVWSCRRVAATHGAYARFALALAPLYIAVMAAIFVRGGPLEMEERFFRPLTFVLVVGVVQAMLASPGRLRWAMAGLAAAGMAYGASSYFVRLEYNRHLPMAARGFRHGSLTTASLELLRRELPGPYGPRDTVILVPWPEIGLDVTGARILGIDGDSAAAIEARTYKGRVKRLYVLMDNRYMADGRAALILASFLDYDRGKWTAVASSDYTLFYQ